MTPTPSSDDPKTRLLAWIDADQAEIVAFLSGFLQAKSPNPPGDTLAAAAHVTGFLDRDGKRIELDLGTVRLLGIRSDVAV